MKKTLITLAASGLILTFAAGSALADSHEGGELKPATPVELFACSYNEGKGPADLDQAIAGWNAWADQHQLTDYSGWTLVPYYFGSEQDFDVLWLGGTSKAAELGRAQDLWLATGSEQLAGFNDVWTCDTHANYSTLQFKKPPERENPSNLVLSFTDCSMADGMTFEDLVPSLMEWAAYREGHGSTSGMWVMFPAYGGGGEGFDFKFVASWQNLAEQGADYDQYNESGWEKGNELFQGKVSCDSSRVYLATNRRTADADDG
ncbi:MAG: hypothetical protein HKP16_11375 [Xanthomonadales bacterium]|nr:hypothetical protein [Xanthomonadales bacterium]